MGEPQVLPGGLPYGCQTLWAPLGDGAFWLAAPSASQDRGQGDLRHGICPRTWGWEQKFSTAATPAGTPSSHLLLQGGRPYWVTLVTLGIFPDALGTAGGCELGSTMVECFPKSASSAASATATSSLPGRGDGGHAELGTPL